MRPPGRQDEGTRGDTSRGRREASTRRRGAPDLPPGRPGTPAAPDLPPGRPRPPGPRSPCPQRRPGLRSAKPGDAAAPGRRRRRQRDRPRRGNGSGGRGPGTAEEPEPPPPPPAGSRRRAPRPRRPPAPRQHTHVDRQRPRVDSGLGAHRRLEPQLQLLAHVGARGRRTMLGGRLGEGRGRRREAGRAGGAGRADAGRTAEDRRPGLRLGRRSRAAPGSPLCRSHRPGASSAAAILGRREEKAQ